MITATTDKSEDESDFRNIVMHVNFNGEERFNFVLNNVENIFGYYNEMGKKVAIRVVCHGPGLHLLRIDTSPVMKRLLPIADNPDGPGFYACANTVDRMTKAEGKKPELIKQAILVPAGLPEIIELQYQGWSYIKP